MATKAQVKVRVFRCEPSDPKTERVFSGFDGLLVQPNLYDCPFDEGIDIVRRVLPKLLNDTSLLGRVTIEITAIREGKDDG